MPEPLYEYRTMSNPNSYLMGEHTLPGHKFSFIKRRRIQYSTKFTGFKPKCSCKTKKFTKWHSRKELALSEFNQHVEEMRVQTLRDCLRLYDLLF